MSGLLQWIRISNFFFFCLFGKLCFLVTTTGLLISAGIIQAAYYRIIVISAEVLCWSFEIAVHPTGLKQIFTAQWFWRKIRFMKRIFCYFSTIFFFWKVILLEHRELWQCVLWKCLFTIIYISCVHCSLKVMQA